MNIETLLELANKRRASDLHLGVGHPPTYRIYGELVRAGEMVTAEEVNGWIQFLLTEAQQAVLKARGEVDLAYTDEGGTRYRINGFHQQGHPTLAIRVVPNRTPAFNELGLPGVLLNLIEQPHGLILVTGPTGSGKTTTLATLIDHLNETQARHIITLEDPIEYLHPHKKSIVHQRQIGMDTSGFAPALRAALRQDPDVIFVGELRDLETVRTAVTASETGHLVLSTLHTGDAVGTIDRLIDMFPAEQQGQIRSQLGSILLAVVSQRLLPTRDKKGRIALAELLLNTPAVSNLIRTQKTHQLKSIMQTSRQAGMQTFSMSARDRLSRGEIDQEVASNWLDA